MNFEIKPKEGFGVLNFTDSTERVVEVLGSPEEVERLDEDDTFNTVVMNYWEQGISIFFEGLDKSVLSCFETDNPESVLFGEKVFEMDEKDICSLMQTNGFELSDDEIEDEGERRLSFDDAMLDFFFEDGELCLVNWGVLVNEHGEVGQI
ncbi:MAG: hypothetical protein ACEPOW_06890 [Bacteroidales bacterium]